VAAARLVAALAALAAAMAALVFNAVLDWPVMV
jgi:hypothetical protein